MYFYNICIGAEDGHSEYQLCHKVKFSHDEFMFMFLDGFKQKYVEEAKELYEFYEEEKNEIEYVLETSEDIKNFFHEMYFGSIDNRAVIKNMIDKYGFSFVEKEQQIFIYDFATAHGVENDKELNESRTHKKIEEEIKKLVSEYKGKKSNCEICGTEYENLELLNHICSECRTKK